MKPRPIFDASRLQALPFKPALPRALTRAERRQLSYLQALELYDESHDIQPGSPYDMDYDLNVWTPVSITKHRIFKNKQGQRQLQVLVNWKIQPSSWQCPKVIQLDHPAVLMKYIMEKGLHNHPDFNWVNTYIDPQCFQQLSFAFQAAQKGPRIKFGVEIPRSVKDALRLDQKNGNRLWQDAMDTELRQIKEYKTFRLPSKGEDLSKLQRIPYHIVWDCKFDGRRKARLVAGGNHTETPKEDIFSGVVGMSTVRLGFFLADLFDLQVCAADIGNAFLYGKNREPVYIRAGPEFGPLEGKPLIIDRSLYGLKSSAARFHEHLSAKLRLLGWRPTKADSDLWIRDAGDHYEYLATYVDDVMVFAKDPMETINALKEHYILKGVGEPEYYLGGDVINLTEDPKHGEAWKSQNLRVGLSSKTYIKNVLEKFELLFEKDFKFKPSKTSMQENYHPETDETEFLGPLESSIYRGMIGSANWIITLGRFDINYATNTLARYSMKPRRGHLEAMKRVFGYLKQRTEGTLVIDKSNMDHTPYERQDYDWTEFYPDAAESLPDNMPDPKKLNGQKVVITVYVDADHAHDLVTRRSVTGIVLFINNTPMAWVSKRQKTVETSTYGSELVAARIATELVMEYRYKLRMLGIEVDGPSLMLGDNMSVVINTSVPSSQLKKKHQACNYHRVREAIAGRIIEFAHIPSDKNIADVMTKPLSGMKMASLLNPVLFRQPRRGEIPDSTANDHIRDSVTK